MRLLLDEMLSSTIARELITRGHDVTAIAGDAARKALSDPDVLALARSQQRAVVTNNVRDFRPLHAEAVAAGGPGHYGITLMRSTYRHTKADTGRIITALESKLVESRASTTSRAPRRGCKKPRSFPPPLPQPPARPRPSAPRSQTIC